MHVYRVEYRQPTGRSATHRYVSERPLAPGEWIAVDGVYVTIERLIRGKRGDPHDYIALCKPAAG